MQSFAFQGKAADLRRGRDVHLCHARVEACGLPHRIRASLRTTDTSMSRERFMHLYRIASIKLCCDSGMADQRVVLFAYDWVPVSSRISAFVSPMIRLWIGGARTGVGASSVSAAIQQLLHRGLWGLQCRISKGQKPLLAAESGHLGAASAAGRITRLCRQLRLVLRATDHHLCDIHGI